MLGYGHDESAPTPDGMFATNFVGERHTFTGCFVGVSWCVRCIIAIRATHYYNMCNAKLKTIRNVIATCSPPIL